MYPSEVLRRCREAARRAPRIREELRSPTPPARGDGGGRCAGDHADPTARLAEWEADGKAALGRELRACEADVRDGEGVVRAVRAAMGDPYADAAEAYWVRALTWDAAAEALGVPRGTLQGRARVAVEWADSATPETLAEASGGFAGL